MVHTNFETCTTLNNKSKLVRKYSIANLHPFHFAIKFLVSVLKIIQTSLSSNNLKPIPHLKTPVTQPLQWCLIKYIAICNTNYNFANIHT